MWNRARRSFCCRVIGRFPFRFQPEQEFRSRRCRLSGPSQAAWSCPYHPLSWRREGKKKTICKVRLLVRVRRRHSSCTFIRVAVRPEWHVKWCIIILLFQRMWEDVAVKSFSARQDKKKNLDSHSIIIKACECRTTEMWNLFQLFSLCIACLWSFCLSSSY